MLDSYLFLLYAVLAAAVAVALLAIHNKRNQTENRFDRAFQQFLATSIRSEDPRYSFDGRGANIVHREVDRSNGESTTYALTIYARNESGEYFSFKSDGEHPLVKHMEHRIAKIVLKTKYLP